jgi:hypothetical protein
VSTDKYPADCPGKAPTGTPPAGGEGQPAQEQDVGEVTESGTARTAGAPGASPGLGRQTAGPAQGKSHPPTQSSEPQSEGRSDDDHARSLAESLDLLRAAVDYLVAKKRRTTAAAVSLEMRRRSNSFTPATAGFATFRQFLRFAEGVGAVTLLPPVPGGDVEVLSATADGGLTEQSAPPTTALKPIRRDLWQAFVDWSPQRQRAFDVRSGRVITVLANKVDSTSNNDSEESASWQEDPTRFRRIIPLSHDDQLQWMRAFVSQLPLSEQRDQLNAALDSEHPLATFVRTARALPDVERSWRRTFTEEVTSAITRWMRQEQLTVDIYHMPSAPSREPGRHVRTAGSMADAPAKQSTLFQHEGDSPDELRRQVLEAVGRMSLSELLRLPIPAEYLLLR